MTRAALVGNDVVDLDDAGVPGERFRHRICGDAERSLLAASDAPEELLWALFAAKEAAYKVAAKLRPGLPFAHRRFVVAPDLRSVRWGSCEVALAVTVGRRWVHALATTGSAATWAVEERSTGEDPSAAARRVLRAGLARTLRCDAAELEVVRDPAPGAWDGRGPPRVLRGGRALDADVSLSHDGRFVAYAAAPGRSG